MVFAEVSRSILEKRELGRWLTKNKDDDDMKDRND